MKIYTKTGDLGETTFFGNERIRKDNSYIEVIGELDELNSIIGVTLCFIKEEKFKETLIRIQNDLFTLGANLAGGRSETEAEIPRITKKHIWELEKEIDKLEKKLGMPKKFILPNGTRASSFLHLCRTVTRRAERTLVGLKGEINPLILVYINRLSDLFYVFARHENKEVKMGEQQPIYKYFKDKWKGISSKEKEMSRKEKEEYEHDKT